jgi:Predicted nucleotide-binding protein containing TIR-like domain
MSELIPSSLRDSIQKKLGNVSSRHVNRLIADIASDQLVSRRAAAMLLARKLKVNFSRYADAEDRAEMRGHTVSQAQLDEAPAASPTVQATREVSRPRVRPAKNNTLFVVHGRDIKLNEDMFALLRALNLNSIEWSSAVAKTRGNNPDVDKIIAGQMKSVQGIVVMISPDEQAKLKGKFCDPTNPSEKTLQDQARPNVLFEAGWAFGAYPGKTLLVRVGNTRPISDLGGKHIMKLSNSPASRKEFAQRLKKMKFKVDIEGTSWLTEGDFDR